MPTFQITDCFGEQVTLQPRLGLYSVTDFMGQEMPGLAIIPVSYTHLFPQPVRIHLFYPFHDLKEPRPPGYTVGLKGRSNGEADGLFCTGEIRHNEIGGEGIKAPFHTFHGGVKRLQINCKIRFISHKYPLLFCL